MTTKGELLRHPLKHAWVLNLGHIFVSDVVQGKVYKVRENHYPANVTVEVDHLEHPIGVAVFKNIERKAITSKDLTGDTVVDVDKLTVEKLKRKLKDIGAWNEKLRKETKEISSTEPQIGFNKRAASEKNSAQEK